MNTSSLRSSAARAAMLGFTAGLRSQIPLAVLARTSSGHDPALLRRRVVRTGLYLSAAGEMVADKLPIVPSRLEPGPLGGRVFFGSLAGAVLANRTGCPVMVGIAAGASGAVAGSFAGYQFRVRAGRVSGLPDPVWAILEDFLAVRLATFAARL